VLNQMLQPSELARAPGLVGPILASLDRDRGFLPGDLVYLVGQLRGIATGAVEFRAVPAIGGKRNGLDVLFMDPSAKEVFRAIREGKPISGVGTQLIDTPPSEANTRVAVIDANSGDKAGGVEQVLTKAGFDVSPGIWDPTQAHLGIAGPAIVFAPGNDVYAGVVSTYFPGVKLVPSAKLHGAQVAIVIPASYTPAPPGSGSTGGSSTSQCPSPSP